ncbi:MAG: glycosyltransferase family 2 protein [bacterium]
MDISVIVPIWNVEEYIERCLRSLFEQTKTDDVEFILVNDCTPDDSMVVARRVIAEYPHLTVRVFEHSENLKAFNTRQTGLDAAVGEYTIQIDADDWCESTMLEDLYAKAIETDADIVYCDLYFGDDLAECILCRQPYCETGYECIEFMLNKFKMLPVLWNKLIRRDLFLRHNIDIRKGELRNGQDFFACIRLFFFTDKIAYLPHPYCHYNSNNPSSLTKNASFSELIVNQVNAIEEFFVENNCNYFNEYILKHKVWRKTHWLRTNKNIKIQRVCIPYFPEVDEHILKSKQFGYFPILYYLAIHGCLPLANILFKLSDWIKFRLLPLTKKI